MSKSLKVYTGASCPSCTMFKNILSQLDVEIEYIDTGKNMDEAIETGIITLPSTIVIEDGKESLRFAGPRPLAFMKELLNAS